MPLNSGIHCSLGDSFRTLWHLRHCRLYALLRQVLKFFAGYLKLLAVLVGTMFFIALVVNPILVWLMIRRNPYPYTLMTLRESGVAAFLHAFVCGKYPS